MKKAFSKLEKAQTVLNGRHPHTLLELFKYIAENPESSERLLRKLRAERPKKQMLAERLVY